MSRKVEIVMSTILRRKNVNGEKIIVWLAAIVGKYLLLGFLLKIDYKIVITINCKSSPYSYSNHPDVIS